MWWLWAACFAAGLAKDVVVKAPDFFTEPIRDGHPLFPDSLVLCDEAEELRIPDVRMLGCLRYYGSFPNLRKLTFGNVDYLPGGFINGFPELEDVALSIPTRITPSLTNGGSGRRLSGNSSAGRSEIAESAGVGVGVEYADIVAQQAVGMEWKLVE